MPLVSPGHDTLRTIDVSQALLLPRALRRTASRLEGRSDLYPHVRHERSSLFCQTPTLYNWALSSPRQRPSHGLVTVAANMLTFELSLFPMLHARLRSPERHEHRDDALGILPESLLSHFLPGSLLPRLITSRGRGCGALQSAKGQHTSIASSSEQRSA